MNHKQLDYQLSHQFHNEVKNRRKQLINPLSNVKVKRQTRWGRSILVGIVSFGMLANITILTTAFVNPDLLSEAHVGLHTK